MTKLLHLNFKHIPRHEKPPLAIFRGLVQLEQAEDGRWLPDVDDRDQAVIEEIVEAVFPDPDPEPEDTPVGRRQRRDWARSAQRHGFNLRDNKRLHARAILSADINETLRQHLQKLLAPIVGVLASGYKLTADEGGSIKTNRKDGRVTFVQVYEAPAEVVQEPEAVTQPVEEAS